MSAPGRTAELERALGERILILDGAMGPMIQAHGLEEADYRGELFRDHPRDLKGNLDFLSLTQPAIVRDIHDAFLVAGADIIETNTFNGTSISQSDLRAATILAGFALYASLYTRIPSFSTI